jgi:uncharacterized protein (DUF2384 family)
MQDFSWMPTVSPAEVAALLGGPRTTGMDIQGWRSAHEAIERGFPSSCLYFLLANSESLHDDLIECYRRFRADYSGAREFDALRRFSPHESGQFWAIAEGIVLATKLLGNRIAANNWLISVIDEEDGYAWMPLDVVRTVPGWRMFLNALDAERYRGGRSCNGPLAARVTNPPTQADTRGGFVTDPRF